MTTRTKAAKKQVKSPTSTAKKAASKKSPARILLPSGVTDGDTKKATPRKSPAKRLESGK
ncbi:hypothetical protein ATI61_101919 [Archangium gephyra]|uniref:Uncharacterized protein n=1 Tax=Archangium gephyra TaxID=48 RepID=A0ABX9KCY8_9BACT|nr:hypothetical protein [Archangium gephyra]REG37929.1 hypothetical protein ATI61_101919 [Archangium gephyra]